MFFFLSLSSVSSFLILLFATSHALSQQVQNRSDKSTLTLDCYIDIRFLQIANHAHPRIEVQSNVQNDQSRAHIVLSGVLVYAHCTMCTSHVNWSVWAHLFQARTCSFILCTGLECRLPSATMIKIARACRAKCKLMPRAKFSRISKF